MSVIGIVVVAAIIIGVISVLSQNYDFISMDFEETQTTDNSGVTSIEAEVDEELSSPTGKQLSVEIDETMGLTAP